MSVGTVESNMSDVVLPDGQPTDTPDAEYADRLDTLAGKTIAFIDWGKPNGPELYECFRKQFTEEFDLDTREYFKKPSPSSPVPTELLEEILELDPDGIIIAIADCGSCNSTSVVDAITFEEENIPTIQVITNAFLELNGTVSASHGYEHLPLVAVDHPTRYLDAEEVEELATTIKWTVHTALTCEECLVADFDSATEA